MLGTSYFGAGPVSHSTHWYTIWVSHHSSSDFIHPSSLLHSKWINTHLAFISMRDNASSTVTLTVVNTATNISKSQAPWMLPVIPCFVGSPINLTGGRFTTRTGLSASILYFVNNITGRWFTPLKKLEVCCQGHFCWCIVHIIVSPWFCFFVVLQQNITLQHKFWWPCHITNWFCNNSYHHLCITWSKLASDSNSFCIPLQSDSTLNSDPQKYFLHFFLAHPTLADSTTNICLDFSYGNTIVLEIK